MTATQMKLTNNELGGKMLSPQTPTTIVIMKHLSAKKPKNELINKTQNNTKTKKTRTYNKKNF